LVKVGEEGGIQVKGLMASQYVVEKLGDGWWKEEGVRVSRLGLRLQRSLESHDDFACCSFVGKKEKKKVGGKDAEKPFTQRSDVLLTHSQEVFGDF